MPKKQLQTPIQQSFLLETAALNSKAIVTCDVILTQMYNCGYNALIESPLHKFDDENSFHPNY